MSCRHASFIRAALGSLLLFSIPLHSLALDTVILKVFANMEDKGEHFIVMTPDGDPLFRLEDLKAIGFKVLPIGSEILLKQEKYVSLRSLFPRVIFDIDEIEATIHIKAAPELFEKRIVNLTRQEPADILFTKESAAFLNYSLGYSLSDDLDFSALTIPCEAGVNIGGRLGFTSFTYTKTKADERFVRLFSNITSDDRKTLRRVVIGDFSAFSGTLGGGGSFGGLSVSKNFSLRPYFVRSPGIEISGVLETPSEVKLYVNEMLVRREYFSPGEFEFLNLPYATGSGDAVLVIKDAYGREEKIEVPFYVSTQLLKPGLHDYSYNFGFKRKELGRKSFEYGDPSFVGFHRFGFSGSFTGGIRAEANRDVANLGGTASFVPWELGETNASLAVSNERGRHGYGGFLSHSYARDNINGGFSVRGYSSEYANLGLSSMRDKLRFEGTVRLGFNQRIFGSLSAAYSVSEFYKETDRRRTSFFYSRRVLKDVSLNVSASRTESDVTNDEIFVELSFHPGTRGSGNLTYQWQDDRSKETASFQQNPTLGTGLEYRFLVDRSEDAQGDRNMGGDAFVQYRGPYGIYSAEYRRVAERNTYNLGTSGGVAFINRSFYLTRPITDGFVLAKVGDLGGVKVKYSNQEVGTTNKHGEIVVPNLKSNYPNELSIEPKDIPVNYEIAEISKYVSPPVRGGGIVKFLIKKLQGFVGNIFIVEKGEKKAAEYWGLKVLIEGETKEFTVGRRGEFYLENLPAGIFPAVLFRADKECGFDLTAPESDDAMVDMGEVTCEMD